MDLSNRDTDFQHWDNLEIARKRYQEELDARVDGFKQDWQALCQLISENTITLDRLMDTYDSADKHEWEVISDYLEGEIRQQIEDDLGV